MITLINNFTLALAGQISNPCISSTPRDVVYFQDTSLHQSSVIYCTRFFFSAISPSRGVVAKEKPYNSQSRRPDPGPTKRLAKQPLGKRAIAIPSKDHKEIYCICSFGLAYVFAEPFFVRPIYRGFFKHSKCYTYGGDNISYAVIAIKIIGSKTEIIAMTVQIWRSILDFFS